MAAGKVIIALGSPREKGNSTTLAHRVADGAREAGADVELFYLHGMDIKFCDGCDTCRKENSKGCHIQDDMQALYPKLLQADAWVIASPIYYFTVSAQTKVFMDRCYALNMKRDNIYKDKRIGIILTYGGSDPFNSGAINAIRTFQDAFAYIGPRPSIVSIIYGSASEVGEIRNNQELMDKAYLLGKKLGAGT